MVTKRSAPPRPSFTSAEATSVSRSMESPTRMGRWKVKRVPANMRRGRGEGGRRPSRAPSPSEPNADWRSSPRK